MSMVVQAVNKFDKGQVSPGCGSHTGGTQLAVTGEKLSGSKFWKRLVWKYAPQVFEEDLPVSHNNLYTKYVTPNRVQQV